MPPKAAITALLFAGFTIALGYGALLPILPGLVQRISATSSLSAAIHHTGFVTASYAGAALVAALLGGWLADRWKPKTLMILALAVGVAATMATAYSPSLPWLYGWRMVSGLAAGTVGPAIQAWLGCWDAASPEWRTRRLVWTAISSTTGFFVGPLIGGLMTVSSRPLWGLPPEWPSLAMIAAVQTLAALLVLAWMQGNPERVIFDRQAAPLPLWRIWAPALEIGLVGLAVSAFEVGLAFPAGDGTSARLEAGALFALCSLVMILVQIVFAVGLLNSRHLGLLKLPATLLLTTGLLGMSFSVGVAPHFASVALVAAAGGALPLIFAHELSVMAGNASGTAGGLSSGTALIGQTLGALLASLVTAASGFPASVFLLAAAVGPVLILTAWWAGPVATDGRRS